LQNNFNLLIVGLHQGDSVNMRSLCKNYHYSLRNNPEERNSHDASYLSTTDSVTPVEVATFGKISRPLLAHSSTFRCWVR
jgi:hypothetical protein